MLLLDITLATDPPPSASLVLADRTHTILCKTVLFDIHKPPVMYVVHVARLT